MSKRRGHACRCEATSFRRLLTSPCWAGLKQLLLRQRECEGGACMTSSRQSHLLCLVHKLASLLLLSDKVHNILKGPAGTTQCR